MPGPLIKFSLVGDKLCFATACRATSYFSDQILLIMRAHKPLLLYICKIMVLCSHYDFEYRRMVQSQGDSPASILLHTLLFFFISFTCSDTKPYSNFPYLLIIKCLVCLCAHYRPYIEIRVNIWVGECVCVCLCKMDKFCSNVVWKHSWTRLRLLSMYQF